MFALHESPFRHAHGRQNTATLIRTGIDPVVVIGALIVCAVAFDDRFDGSYLILALLVFAMTYPGNLGRGVAGSGRPLREIVADWLAIVGLLLLLGWASQTLHVFDARALAAWTLATPAALYVAHRLVPALLARALAREGLRKTAVIAGANELGHALAQRLRANAFLGIGLAGYFDDRAARRPAGIVPNHVLGPLGQLADFVKRQHVDLIYITLPMSSQPRIRRLLDDLHDTTTSIYFVPDIMLFDLIQARVATIGGIPVLAVCESPYCGIDALLKRTFDLAVALALLVLGAPLLLAIAAGVKFDSPGPVFFKQRRYGLDGRKIVVYKFRTMTCLQDGNEVPQASREDPRTTRFGAFLRRYSLDELPQFVNVIQGRMSVVGPRPHAVAHNELYRKLIRGYMIRHKVPPGITGLAQVNGLRGETDTLDKMRARIECDLDYLRHWSLLLDLQIVLKTILVVLRGDNAY